MLLRCPAAGVVPLLQALETFFLNLHMFALQGWSLSELRHQEVGQIEETMLAAHHFYVSRGSRPN